ncbi:MAG: acetolactate synthase large subunit, partial [Clostridiales bacterium]|nr:acetolactate synthase large subunit [Clostridiales bacterium]
MKQLTGSEIVIECLKEQGVDTVFGYPGGTILNVYDALYKHPEIHHVLTSHEQGASHAADGYARATGKVGVCMATSGPGATNLVTGIATAYMDSIPLVAITANVGVSLLGKDSFQEIDIAGVVMPITKHSFIVKNVHELADTIRRAFKIAKTGRPGPVLVDITKDVTSNLADYEYKKPEEIAPVTDTIWESDIETVAKMIAKSKKPYIMVGGGAVASGAYKEVREFVEKMDAPVCDTLMGKGVIDGNDPHYTGMIGMHGTKVSNFGVTEADLLIVIGGRFSDRVIGNAKKFANNAKIVQIDVDAAEINKNIVVDASIIGDAKEILTRLNAVIDQQDHKEWKEEILSMEEKYPNTYPTDVFTGPTAISKIYELTKGDAIITTDVGQHQMWAA